MAFEKLRLLIGAALLFAAGAIAASAEASARTWITASVLLLAALAGLWPLARPRSSAAPTTDSPPHPDARRLSTLQVQLEHLPVAAWIQTEQALEPLTSRARRLSAPGGVRDREVLHQLLRTSERNGPVTLDTERGSERWQLQRQVLAVEGKAQALIALTPLEQELESESLHAWQQLLRVLTHEIMNSLTPIKSLSETANNLLGEPDSSADLRTALDAIARRAESLSSFVSNYRRVSQWPQPTLAPVDLAELFKRLQQAVAQTWAGRGGEISFEVSSPGLRLMADEGQLEQVLLALINNAEQATAEQIKPRLWVLARQSRGGRLQISVRDNGSGVPVGLERQIFLPFFSTREGGQGIGLTVVRQLMFGMGGRVRHVRPLEKGAMFVLSF
ncbi:sensor histidine kinase [Peristeroidobacter agariperforans]|uniref:sensor histidine kinase n=1 Tax=Peristeroidobacter agariperforans TaxID=268404 RepID=UPI00101D3C6D|nr:ATP-binding protein [Peristeroidobacter agariperforans]